VTIFLAVSLRSLTHVIAHKAAYDAGILHQDISAGNILIAGKDELDPEDPYESKIEGGILIDWDLSNIVNPNDTTAHRRAVS
jgi:Ser/Thr protein kinase RdoA (MazF antagonist)